MFAGLLYEKGYGIKILETGIEADRIRTEGISVTGDRDIRLASSAIEVYSSHELENIGNADVVFVGVKTPFLEQIASYLNQLDMKKPVFMYQNGLHPELTLREFLIDRENVIGGVLMGKASTKNRVVEYSFNTLHTGAWDETEQATEHAELITSMLDDTGFPVYRCNEKEYREKRLEKVVYNLVNSITAVFGLDGVSPVLENSFMKYSINQKIEEAEKLGEQLGLDLEDIKEKSVHVFTKIVPNHPTSMRQDFQRLPVLTEIEHLDGAVYKLCGNLGIEARYNRLYFELIKNFSSSINNVYKTNPEKAEEYRENCIKTHRKILNKTHRQIEKSLNNLIETYSK